MLKKTCDIADLKLYEEEDGSGYFTGYGSTFGNFDRVKEAVVKGAFKNTLDSFKQDGFIAVGHDWGALPVATVGEAYEDDKGLFIKGEFHSTPEAQAARAVVKERLERGKSVGLSIGYDVKDQEHTRNGTLLKELELFEVSIVTVPCNALANATGVKALQALSVEDFGAELKRRITEDPKAKEFFTRESLAAMAAGEVDAEVMVTDPEGGKQTLAEWLAAGKAVHLGQYVEADMTWAALRDLTDSLFWHCVYDCLYPYGMEPPSLEERIGMLREAFTEYAEIAVRAIEALMTPLAAGEGDLGQTAPESGRMPMDDDDDYMKSMIRLLWNDPKEIPAAARAAKAFNHQLDAALAAVEGCIARGKAIKAIRETDGRDLSDERRAQITALKDALEALAQPRPVPAAEPSVKQIVDAALIKHIARKQRSRELSHA